MDSERMMCFHGDYDMIREMEIFSNKQNEWGHTQYTKEEFTVMASRVDENICKVVLGVAHLARQPNMENVLHGSISQMIENMVSIGKLSVHSYGTDRVAITISRLAIESVLYVFTHRKDFFESRGLIDEIFRNDKLTIVFVK